MFENLQGRSVIVTGGGSGIGTACATRLAAEGANVTICGRNRDKLDAVVEKWAADPSGGGEIRALTADVTDEADVEGLVDDTVSRTGALHGVVANAGGGGAIAPYHRQDVDEFLRVLHLNVLGTMLLVKHSVGHLKAAGTDEPSGAGGSFVAMSSLASHLTHPHFGAYTVAKAGQDAMIRNAADEYGQANVRFNSVRPGFTSTEIMGLIPRDSEVYASYIDNTPLAGVGEPADVAGLVAFLLSDQARWINGQAINVDGGHALRSGPDFSSFVQA